MRKFEIKKIHVKELRSFISKVSSVTPALHVNVDSEYMYSKITNDEKTLCKIAPVDVEDVFEFKEAPDGNLKFSFAKAKTISDSLKHLSEENLSGEIYFTEEKGEYEAVEFHVFDKKLRFKFRAMDAALDSNELPNEMAKSLFDSSEAAYSFELMATDVKSAKEINGMDKTEEVMGIIGDGSGVRCNTEIHDLLFDEECTDGDGANRLVNKEDFAALDDENYRVYVVPEDLSRNVAGRAIFKSHDTKTLAVIGFVSAPSGE